MLGHDRQAKRWRQTCKIITAMAALKPGPLVRAIRLSRPDQKSLMDSHAVNETANAQGQRYRPQLFTSRWQLAYAKAPATSAHPTISSQLAVLFFLLL